MPAAVHVEGLTKSYGDRSVLKGLDLTIEEGEILAFLGANGAGKTTTIEILEGFRDRDGGSVSVLGQDPSSAPLSWREEIGIVLQESEPVPELTAFESIQMQSSYYEQPRDPQEILKLVGLEDSRDQRTRKLSGGQKRRLDLAMALVGDPKLIFLDEPTTGFDPSARRESWGMIEALRELGRTVLLTTHYMDEAQHLADRIVVVRDGVVTAEGTADQLAQSINAQTIISWRHEPGAALPSGLDAEVTGERATIEVADPLVVLNTLTSWATGNGHDLPELEVKRPTLEDTYLELVGPSAESPPDVPAPSGRRRRR